MRLLKRQIFEKKAIFPVKNILWPKYFCSIEDEKCQETTYKGPEGNLTCIVLAL